MHLLSAHRLVERHARLGNVCATSPGKLACRSTVGLPVFGLLARFEFLGGQFLLLIGWGFVAWLGGMIHFRPSQGKQSENPIFVVDVVADHARVRRLFVADSRADQLAGRRLSFRIGSRPGFGCSKVLQSPIAWKRRFTKINIAVACSVCLLVTFSSHNTHVVWPMMASVAKRIKSDDPYSIRRVDPTCRLRGWSTLGARSTKSAKTSLNSEGSDPVLAALYWNMPGEISFYCAGHPQDLFPGAICRRTLQSIRLMAAKSRYATVRSFKGQTFVVVNGAEAALTEHV